MGGGGGFWPLDWHQHFTKNAIQMNHLLDWLFVVMDMKIVKTCKCWVLWYCWNVLYSLEDIIFVISFTYADKV